MYVHVWVGTLNGQKKAFDPLELELQVVVLHWFLHLIVLLVKGPRVECSAKAYLLGQPGQADTVSYLPF